jgi:hypothetical protein
MIRKRASLELVEFSKTASQTSTPLHQIVDQLLAERGATFRSGAEAAGAVSSGRHRHLVLAFPTTTTPGRHARTRYGIAK